MMQVAAGPSGFCGYVMNIFGVISWTPTILEYVHTKDDNPSVVYIHTTYEVPYILFPHAP